MKKFIYGILGFLFAIIIIGCSIRYGALKGFQHSPSVTMIWKDYETITIQAGKYFIDGKILDLAANTDWSWTLDTGAQASATWYYFYAYDNAGVVGSVGSLTYPTTSRFDINLSGTTYDKNIYLGAFRNDADSRIQSFLHIKEEFLVHVDTGNYTVTSNTNAYVSKTIVVPVTASICIGKLGLQNIATASCIGFLSANGTHEYDYEYHNVTTNTVQGFVLDVPLFTPQTIWLKNSTNNASDYAVFIVDGWIDKWL